MDDDLNTEEKSNSESGRFSERVSFIIGFSALVIALLPYKEFAQDIIISIFSWNFSLYTLIGIFFAILFFSTYFYGLNYIRYRFPLLLNIRWLKFIELIADILYITAFIFPILVIILAFVSYCAKIVPNLTPYATIISIIISVLVGLLTPYISFYTYRNKEKELIKKLFELHDLSEGMNQEQDPRKLYILNLYESIVSSLEALLVPYVGRDIQRVSRYEILKLAHGKKIISQEEMAMIDDLRGLRNQIAHNKSFNKTGIDQEFLGKAKNILTKLTALNLSRDLAR